MTTLLTKKQQKKMARAAAIADLIIRQSKELSDSLDGIHPKGIHAMCFIKRIKFDNELKELLEEEEV